LRPCRAYVPERRLAPNAGTVLNGIFLFLIVGSVLVASFMGTMGKVTNDGIEAAKTAVTLAIGLIGQMALWLGFMRILRDGGLLKSLARAMAPVMTRLFKDVPADHPAMAAMIMNLGANVLGLGNAATPFGLKAMKELDRLNEHKGVTTNAMSLFLAINTSGVAVLPLGVIAVRASLGAKGLGGIIVPSILATSCSTIAAIIVCKLVEKLPRFAPERYVEAAAASEPRAEIKGMKEAEEIASIEGAGDPVRSAIAGLVMAVVAGGLVYTQLNASPDQTVLDAVKTIFSEWLLPVLMCAIVLFGFARKVRVYESLITGAKEGFEIAVMIIPFLVAILVGIGMFRASGAMEILITGIRYVTDPIGFPAEALPMALIRPLSGSGALAVMTDTMKTYGPDSFIGFLVSIMNGSMETTFYVLAVYFGSVGVRATRHTLLPCLVADLVGITASVIWAHVFF
jgi:spore maturation protein SpmA